MGRKAVPKVLRELHGNPGRRAANDEPEGQGDLWSPPRWFDADQRAQWDYAIDHAPPGLLTGTDREVLAIWVVACVEHARAVVKVRELGQVVKTNAVVDKTGAVVSGGNFIQNPYLPIVNKQAMLMLKAGSELGFSPAARASLGSSAPEFNDAGTAGRPARTIKGSLAGYLDQKPDVLDS